MMELKLKKTDHEYYEPVEFMPYAGEITRENIVPDSCADIARVVETTGRICLTSRELSGDGRFCAGGKLDVVVLYIPEKGTGPCTLRYQIPFQCCGESTEGAEVVFEDICAELQGLETRLLNPRKVLTRANMTFYPQGCRRTAVSVAEEVEDCERIQVLREEKESRVVASVREKEFTVSEELPLSPGRPGAEEIISTRADIRSCDCKLIGNKLVLKGICGICVLYRDEEGKLNTLQQDMPFSQILDGSRAEEEWESETNHTVLGAECRLGTDSSPDDPHILSLTLQLRSRVVLWRMQRLRLIADLYSIQGDAQCESMELCLWEEHTSYTRRQNVRELLETGAAVKAVVDTEVGCGRVRAGGDGSELEASVWARCLFLDENDVLHSVRRSFPAACQIQKSPQARAEGSVSVSGEVMVSILPEGVELRFPVEWSVMQHTPRRCLCVSSVEVAEPTSAGEAVPSLILRKVGREESLWSVAKQYRTTCRAILEANELTEELPVDRLLLIPRAK